MCQYYHVLSICYGNVNPKSCRIFSNTGYRPDILKKMPRSSSKVHQKVHQCTFFASEPEVSAVVGCSRGKSNPARRSLIRRPSYREPPWPAVNPWFGSHISEKLSGTRSPLCQRRWLRSNTHRKAIEEIYQIDFLLDLTRLRSQLQSTIVCFFSNCSIVFLCFSFFSLPPCLLDSKAVENENVRKWTSKNGENGHREIVTG